MHTAWPQAGRRTGCSGSWRHAGHSGAAGDAIVYSASVCSLATVSCGPVLRPRTTAAPNPRAQQTKASARVPVHVLRGGAGRRPGHRGGGRRGDRPQHNRAHSARNRCARGSSRCAAGAHRAPRLWSCAAGSRAAPLIVLSRVILVRALLARAEATTCLSRPACPNTATATTAGRRCGSAPRGCASPAGAKMPRGAAARAQLVDGERLRFPALHSGSMRYARAVPPPRYRPSQTRARTHTAGRRPAASCARTVSRRLDASASGQWCAPPAPTRPLALAARTFGSRAPAGALPRHLQPRRPPGILG
jgi:hypothetical protein